MAPKLPRDPQLRRALGLPDDEQIATLRTMFDVPTTSHPAPRRWQSRTAPGGRPANDPYRIGRVAIKLGELEHVDHDGVYDVERIIDNMIAAGYRGRAR